MKYKLREYNINNTQKHRFMVAHARVNHFSEIKMKELYLHMFLGTVLESKYIDQYIEQLYLDVQQKYFDAGLLMFLKMINQNINDPKLEGLTDIPKFAIMNRRDNKILKKFITREEAIQYCKNNGYVLQYK